MAKYWCKSCQVFVENSLIGKKNHEASNKHKFSVQRAIKEIYIKQRVEEREKEKADREFERIQLELGNGNQANGGKFYKKNQINKSQLLKQPVKVELRKQNQTDEKLQDITGSVGIGNWVSVTPTKDSLSDKFAQTHAQESSSSDIPGTETLEKPNFGHENLRRWEILTKESSGVDIEKLLNDQDDKLDNSTINSQSIDSKPMFKKRGKNKKKQ